MALVGATADSLAGEDARRRDQRHIPRIRNASHYAPKYLPYKTRDTRGVLKST